MAHVPSPEFLVGWKSKVASEICKILGLGGVTHIILHFPINGVISVTVTKHLTATEDEAVAKVLAENAEEVKQYKVEHDDPMLVAARSRVEAWKRAGGIPKATVDDRDNYHNEEPLL
jgi:hypothetical protein